jgi:hypothetical protein
MNARLQELARPFYDSLVANPEDANTLLACCDFLEENGGEMDRWDAAGIQFLRNVGAALPKAHAEWLRFKSRLDELIPNALNYQDTIPVMTRDRHIPQKVQARFTRGFFQELKLPGVSVKMATGSMCFWVNVDIPGRHDFAYLRTLCDDAGHAGPGYVENKDAEEKVKFILARAFPNHDDRSDSLTDHFDMKFRIAKKGIQDYLPKTKKAR